MMWLLTAWGGIQRVFKAAMSYPLQAALIVTVLACGWLYWGKQNALADLGRERAAHIATKANYTKAQIKAAELNAAKVALIERERREIASAKDIEIRYGIDRAVADARRVWAARAAQSFAGGSTASGTATGPVDINGAGGMSIMDESDVRICTINTMKAKGWQDFYSDLADE